MSYFKTKQALVTQLIAANVVASTEIAFENKTFNPANKSIWLACYFIPATSEMMGKGPTSGDERRGIFQVSVFIDKNNEDYDNDQLSMVDNILNGFQYNSSTVFDGQTVQILESNVNAGRESEAWFQRDVSIDYLAFADRLTA